MYEVTYSIDGIVRTLDVPASDAVQAQQIITNMFGKGNVQIINWKRKWEKMEEKIKEMEEIFGKLTEDNKSILLMVANGMILTQKQNLKEVQKWL